MPGLIELALMATFWILRPVGRWLAPFYAGSGGRRALLITCAIAAVGFWASFPVSSRSIVLAICLVVLAPLSAMFALVSYVDAKRARRVERVFVHQSRPFANRK